MRNWLKSALPKTLIEWVHLFWMAACGVIVVILLSMFVQVVWLGSDYKQWDFLAFAGSVIGGVITWIGVNASIKNYEIDRKEKERGEAAKKTRILDRTIGTLNELGAKFKSMSNLLQNWLHNFPEIGSGRDSVDSSLHMANKDYAVAKLQEILDESVNVDANIYKAMVELGRSIEQANLGDKLAVQFMKNGDYQPQETVNTFLSYLKVLARDIDEARKQVINIRKYYLRILFPNEDPDLIHFDQ